MSRIRVNCETFEQAVGFAEGVQYVNESSVRVVDFGPNFVLLEDTDADEDGEITLNNQE